MDRADSGQFYNDVDDCEYVLDNNDSDHQSDIDIQIVPSVDDTVINSCYNIHIYSGIISDVLSFNNHVNRL